MNFEITGPFLNNLTHFHFEKRKCCAAENSEQADSFQQKDTIKNLYTDFNISNSITI